MAIAKRVSKAKGSVSYQVVIDQRDPATGERFRTVVGTFRLKKDAEQREREALIERDRGSFVDPTRLTVNELLDAWLESKRHSLSANSRTDYEIAIRLWLKPSLGSRRVQQLKAEHVQAAYAVWREAERPAGPRTIARCHSVLSQALDQAMKRHVVVANVMTAVERPSLPHRAPNVWTPAQTSAFLAEARKDGLNPLWHFLAMEGMRRGEALGLRWKDVDFETGTAHIQQSAIPDRGDRGRTIIQSRTKTAAGTRSVRLTGQTLTVLRAHRTKQLERQLASPEWQDFDLIVTTGHGTPVNANNVSRSFERLIRVTRLPRIRVHDLRHGAATMLLMAGEPAKVVSERLGHANIAITLDLYSHVLPNMQERAAAAMDALVAELLDA